MERAHTATVVNVLYRFFLLMPSTIIFCSFHFDIMRLQKWYFSEIKNYISYILLSRIHSYLLFHFLSRCCGRIVIVYLIISTYLSYPSNLPWEFLFASSRDRTFVLRVPSSKAGILTVGPRWSLGLTEENLVSLL